MAKSIRMRARTEQAARNKFDKRFKTMVITSINRLETEGKNKKGQYLYRINYRKSKKKR
jgi:hypothetical protein